MQVGKKKAKELFAKWLKENDPFLYRVALKRNEIVNASQQVNGLSGSVADFFNNIIDTVKTTAPQVLQYNQQKKIMEMQLKRAEQGLPPANVDDYTPSVKIAPVITPATEQAITRVAVQSAKEGVGAFMGKWGMPLGVGAALLFLFRKKIFGNR